MKRTSSATERRRTTFERLEDRYLLTAAIVNTNLMDDGGNPLTTTLAEAIARVNGLPNESNTISFSITSGSVNNPDPSQINVNANLPIITAPNVLIDGSNVGQAGAPRMKLVRVGGILESGLQVDSSSTASGNVTIRDFEITSFASDGIRIVGLGDNDQVNVQDNLLHHNTGTGVRYFGSSATVSSRVVISGNYIWANGDGILMTGTAAVTPKSPHSISGNFVGVTSSGNDCDSPRLSDSGGPFCYAANAGAFSASNCSGVL